MSIALRSALTSAVKSVTERLPGFGQLAEEGFARLVGHSNQLGEPLLGGIHLARAWLASSRAPTTPTPKRQQIMLRRGLALGGGLILDSDRAGVKGCLDARAKRELSDYARNVTQIVEETE